MQVESILVERLLSDNFLGKSFVFKSLLLTDKFTQLLRHINVLLNQQSSQYVFTHLF